MELDQAIRSRRMTRRFGDGAVDAETLADVLSAAATAPSAGATRGTDLLVLTTPESRDRFWEVTTDLAWRERASTGGSAAGLLPAPVIVLPIPDQDAYVERYSQPDKAASGLAGRTHESWDVPYWLVDTSFATMLLLLAAHDAGLGALFFRLHRDPADLLRELGVPEGRRPIGALALGRPADRHGPQPSTSRERPLSAARMVHMNRW